MDPSGLNGFPEKSWKIEKEGNIGIKARTVIWFLTFSGFAINCILMNNVPFAIVNMVDISFQSSIKNQSEAKVIISSECIIEVNLTLQAELSNKTDVNENNLIEHLIKGSSHVSLEKRFLDLLNINYERDGFKWDEHKQAQVLGSFYWIHWVTQIPGGILAARYGTKFVFGACHLIASVLSIMMPIFCYFDYRWMMALRLIQGFIMGSVWPAMHNLIGQWIPPNERSLFVSAYFGGAIGAAIAFPLFGLLVKWTSWEWIFHASGVSGIIWYILWQYYVYDTPEQHPRIHPIEKKYILQSLGSSITHDNNKKADVPWKAILTSKALLINTLGHFGTMFGILTVFIQLPSYFKYIHGWGSEATGLLSGLPNLLLVPFSIAFSKFVDNLLTKEKMTRNNVRRLASFVGTIVNGCFILGLAYSGCNVTLAVVFLTMASTCNAASSASVLSSIVDIAPNYAGITMGIISTIGSMSGFVSPIVVGYITFENQTVQAWKHVFQICGFMLIGSGIIYISFVDTSVQKWNNITASHEEIKPLKNIEVKKH